MGFCKKLSKQKSVFGFRFTLFKEVVFFFQAIFGYHEPPTTPWKINYGFGHLKTRENYHKSIQPLDSPNPLDTEPEDIGVFLEPLNAFSKTEVWRLGVKKNTDPSSRERYLED